LAIRLNNLIVGKVKGAFMGNNWGNLF